MSTILFFLQFAVGLFLIFKGADWLTDGSSAIARRFNISSLVIGLTIVAFGTSAPELVVSVLAAINNQPDMSIGNVIGSNIFNSLAIAGGTALISPIICTRNNLRYDIPLCIISSIAAVATCTTIGSFTLTTDTISRTDGIILLCFFLIFISYTFAIAHQGVDDSDNENRQTMSVTRSIVVCVLGLAGLILGGNWMVDGASGIAEWLGVSERTIALTIVAGGTSFPELITSVVAARKGDTDMALGNVLGSNIFNVFLVLGTAATITPLTVGDITFFDLGTLLVANLLLWIFCVVGKPRFTVTRPKGLILVLLAIAYYTIAVITA